MAPPEREFPTNGRRGTGLSRRSLLTGLAVFGGLAAAGCGRVPAEGKEEGGDLLERLRDRGTVKLGIASERPYGYINDEGEPTGTAPEIAKVIFGRLGVDNVEPVPVDFSALIPGLKAQVFDVVSAGMYIMPERCAQVLFADPEYQMPDSFIVPAGNPNGITRYEDIAEQGLTLATGQAYAEIDYALAAGVPESRLMILPDQVAGLDAVSQGRADAFAGTNLTVTGTVEGNSRVEATEAFVPIVNGEPAYGAGGFAFRLSEGNLRDAFNEKLHEMKGSGELLEIMAPFGFTEAEMTELTAEELC
ncbi:ectoine/hydroxyectoine ABC transporter substrate-binding protein EhuB [Streptomyces sp. DSM 44915]|uniref:Ectoine/hydroxyectoine ABC transporter substrate-binding protein EhuB n=1 Tax=Streptomyces chisholmiae TaxID=3075540 RepID=A0ABU2JT22_9ACTN|nr:ectoine/hydroxyectoine ABC transporter substrate-binding protein EhuB [Streptomyces sp. DSM 44915]MDT0267906.1 ectoine/hydroxyectoine ABC transporter substrate-binding protein EhuB [Streptomyces sp. DSM 44915]